MLARGDAVLFDRIPPAAELRWAAVRLADQIRNYLVAPGYDVLPFITGAHPGTSDSAHRIGG